MIALPHKKRLIHVTDGNIGQNHITVTGLFDFLPKDCIGPSRRTNGQTGTPIRIELDGLGETIETDIGSDRKSGKPRHHFRGRWWVKRFFQHHGVRSGDVLELERLEERLYYLRMASQQGLRNEEPIRVLEFFAGIGLVRLAVERQGMKVVFANDIDADKLQMYEANFAATDFKLGDIHDLRARNIPDCELATASFPCTDLSIAGAMNGIHSGESSAFWGLIKLLREMKSRRPPFILLENVPGFLMSHNGQDFESAMLALNELDYAVDAFFVDAASFVPQSRLRLFVVGRREAPGSSSFELIHSAARPQSLIQFIVSHPELRWSLRPLPPPPTRKSTLASIIEDLPDGDSAWWNQERADYFMNQLSDRHAGVAQGMIASRTISYATAFRRVRHGRSMAEIRSDGVAGCLRTPKGGSGRQILFKGGRGRYQVRLLTSRECARLQGVPDDYKITVPLNQALFGFGDAVCVPVIEWIATNYLAPEIAKLAGQNVKA